MNERMESRIPIVTFGWDIDFGRDGEGIGSETDGADCDTDGADCDADGADCDADGDDCDTNGADCNTDDDRLLNGGEKSPESSSACVEALLSAVHEAMLQAVSKATLVAVFESMLVTVEPDAVWVFGEDSPQSGSSIFLPSWLMKKTEQNFGRF